MSKCLILEKDRLGNYTPKSIQKLQNAIRKAFRDAIENSDGGANAALLIKELKKEKNNKANKEEIKRLYNKLDDMLYIKDYMAIVFDNKADFDRACGKQGFEVNGIKFKRLVGTTGGVKQNTVMFCSERIHKDLNELLECGRNKDFKIIPAKYEAYKALSASVSTPVSMPRILVIKDGTVRIKDKVIRVSGDKDFIVEHGVDYEADKDFTDGAGMITYEMASKWAEDLHLDYVPSGFNALL